MLLSNNYFFHDEIKDFLAPNWKICNKMVIAFSILKKFESYA